jgi:hypothetical protein
LNDYNGESGSIIHPTPLDFLASPTLFVARKNKDHGRYAELERVIGRLEPDHISLSEELKKSQAC